MVFEFTVAEGIEVLTPLFFFIIGMSLYSVFIFKFYRFLARKDIFKLDMDKYNKAKHPTLKKFVGTILYFIEYVVLFPVFTFFWFAVLTVLLTFLAKEQGVQNILIVSISVVTAVRITAYYNEDLSRDLAKMLPFALLGVFLVNITYFSFMESVALLQQIPPMLNIVAYYLVFVIIIEFVLRIGHGLYQFFLGGK